MNTFSVVSIAYLVLLRTRLLVSRVKSTPRAMGNLCFTHKVPDAVMYHILSKV